MSTNRRVRESPAKVADVEVVCHPPSSFKTGGEEEVRKATEQETAGQNPSQEIARETECRDSAYTTRSHKYIALPGQLPDSPQRMDSREQCYSILSAWDGMGHE